MGLVNDSENDNRVRKTNTTKKRLEYFTLWSYIKIVYPYQLIIKFYDKLLIKMAMH